MNDLIQSVAYFVASGDAFFAGALLIVFGHVASWRFRQRPNAKWLRLLTVLGVVLWLAAVVPLPLWLHAACLGLASAWINLPFANPDTAWRYQQLRRLQPLVELLLLLAIGWELWERTALNVVAPDELPSEIHVVGDSLSAGIADEREFLWPNLVVQRLNVRVFNHAQPGATTESAQKQADQIRCESCWVLVEIGGNDLLGGRDAALMERDFELLLTSLAGCGRTIVMFELPVVPLPGAYRLARVQRRLAKQLGVRLIPRRAFAKVLFSDGSTIDSLHLSRIGHQRIAELVSELFRGGR
jgi:lysophospholipase L1-like esterase